MIALSIDTSGDRLAVTLTGDVKDEIYLGDAMLKHSVTLMPSIEQILTENGLTLNDIDVFAAVTGPGSFTGIRIGVSTANALSYGSGAELVDVNAFEAMAYGIKDALCLIDALHGNYYFAKVTGGVISETGYMEKAQADEDKSEKVFRTVDRTYASNLAAVIKDKAEKNQTAKKLMPLYLRKSQAEREAEERGNL